MTDIVKSNFDEKFEEIEKAIKQCNFIALDTEFTGLQLSLSDKNSLFDDGATRYAKLREIVSAITICQFGLSIFTKNKDESSYVATTYNFYLCPRSFGPVSMSFKCQASALQFLCRYKFDFNKFVYDGISFLNDDQEALLRAHLANREMFSGLERDLDEREVEKVCSRVVEWLVTDKAESFILDTSDMGDILPYVMSMELRSRFPNIQTFHNDRDKKIEIVRCNAADREESDKSDSANHQQQEEQLIQDLLGFTRLFRVMRDAQKPLIGHNMMFDLLLMYHLFYKPLPSSYSEFKSSLHGAFPVIFDTKHISSRLRPSLQKQGLLRFTSLSEVYRDLQSAQGRDVVINPPQVTHDDRTNGYAKVDSPHEAGYDAYLTGCVFLRMSHILTYKDVESSKVIPCTFQRYLRVMSKHKNIINLIRARVYDIRLDGADYVPARPDMLYVRPKGLKKLNMDQLAKWFSAYGSVDVKPYYRNSALAATNSFQCYRDIVKGFRGHHAVKVTTYSVWRHSPVARGILWSSVAVTGAIGLWVLFGTTKKD